MRCAVNSTNVTGTGVVRSAPGAFHGVTLRETVGTNACVIRIYDNASAASGTLLFTCRIPPGGSVDVYYPVEDARGGVRADNGLYIQVTDTGTLEGSVRHAG